MQLLAAPLLPARDDAKDWDCRGFEARGGMGSTVQHAGARVRSKLARPGGPRPGDPLEAPLGARSCLRLRLRWPVISALLSTQAHDENFKPIRISSSSASGAMETWAAVAARAAHTVLRRKRRRLLQAICASGVVLLLEAAGGAVAHSLALMSDATHMLADISSYGIALIAVQASMDPAFTGGSASAFDCGQTEAARQRLASKSTFGLHRVEVLTLTLTLAPTQP